MDEIVHGSPGHPAMTAAEFVRWIAYDQIVADEQARARREAE